MSDAFTPTPQATAPADQAVTPVATPHPSAARAPLPWEQPASQPEAAHPPVQQAAPEAPEATPSPAPTTPTPDPEIERLRREAAEFEEVKRRAREYQEQQAREAEINARNEAFNRQASEIWDLAQRFDTDDERRAFYNSKIAALRAETEQYYRAQVEAEREQLQQERMAQYITGYPDYLKQLHGLDDDEVEQLRQFTDPTQMTVTASFMASMKSKYGELRSLAEQAKANTEAAYLRSTVTSGSISGAPGATELPTRVRAGTAESRAFLADALGIRN